MSEIAGRLAVQVGAYHLMRPVGGSGVLMGGIAGTPRAHVVVLGGGVAGTHAAQVASGMGADVTVVDVSLPRLRTFENRFHGRIHTALSSPMRISSLLDNADLVIGAVLVAGGTTPSLVTSAMVETMRPGSVLVDVAIDQGGCFEPSRPTTHDDPTYTVHNSIFYCVANMPGAVPAPQLAHSPTPPSPTSVNSPPTGGAPQPTSTQPSHQESTPPVAPSPTRTWRRPLAHSTAAYPQSVGRPPSCAHNQLWHTAITQITKSWSQQTLGFLPSTGAQVARSHQCRSR